MNCTAVIYRFWEIPTIANIFLIPLNRSMASMVHARGTRLSSPRPTSVTASMNEGSTPSGIGTISSCTESPWNTYRLFVELGPSECLVLCNNQTEVRMMRIFGNTSDVFEMTNAAPFPLIAIQHPNFVVTVSIMLTTSEKKHMPVLNMLDARSRTCCKIRYVPLKEK